MVIRRTWYYALVALLVAFFTFIGIYFDHIQKKRDKKERDNAANANNNNNN
jgi:hypothetical protein